MTSPTSKSPPVGGLETGTFANIPPCRLVQTTDDIIARMKAVVASFDGKPMLIGFDVGTDFRDALLAQIRREMRADPLRAQCFDPVVRLRVVDHLRPDVCIPVYRVTLQGKTEETWGEPIYLPAPVDGSSTVQQVKERK